MSFLSGDILQELSNILNIDVSKGLTIEEISALEISPEITLPIIISGMALSASQTDQINHLVSRSSTGNVESDVATQNRAVNKAFTTIKNAAERGFGFSDPEIKEKKVSEGDEPTAGPRIRPRFRPRFRNPDDLNLQEREEQEERLRRQRFRDPEQQLGEEEPLLQPENIPTFHRGVRPGLARGVAGAAAAGAITAGAIASQIPKTIKVIPTRPEPPTTRPPTTRPDRPTTTISPSTSPPPTGTSQQPIKNDHHKWLRPEFNMVGIDFFDQMYSRKTIDEENTEWAEFNFVKKIDKSNYIQLENFKNNKIRYSEPMFSPQYQPPLPPPNKKSIVYSTIPMNNQINIKGANYRRTLPADFQINTRLSSVQNRTPFDFNDRFTMRIKFPE